MENYLLKLKFQKIIRKLLLKLKIHQEDMQLDSKNQPVDFCGLESPSEIEMMRLILVSSFSNMPIEIKCTNIYIKGMLILMLYNNNLEVKSIFHLKKDKKSKLMLTLNLRIQIQSIFLDNISFFNDFSLDSDKPT